MKPFDIVQSVVEHRKGTDRGDRERHGCAKTREDSYTPRQTVAYTNPPTTDTDLTEQLCALLVRVCVKY